MSKINPRNIKYDYIIYKIVLEDGYCYVGSTRNFKKRVLYHLSYCRDLSSKSYSCNTLLYRHIRYKKLKFDKDNFIVLERVENITKRDIEKKEEEYLKIVEIETQGKILNEQRAFLTKEDEKKKDDEWYKNNRERILEEGKKRYQENKGKISEKKKETYICPCDPTNHITKSHKTQHERSKKHQKYLQTLSQK